EPLARLVGEDGELAAPVERPREIELVAVEPGEERGPRQTCADVRLDEIGDGDSGRHLLARAIWERDLDLLSHQTRRPGAPGLPSSERLVRPAGIEPATPTVSRWCSTAELRTRAGLRRVAGAPRPVKAFRPPAAGGASARRRWPGTAPSSPRCTRPPPAKVRSAPAWCPLRARPAPAQR